MELCTITLDPHLKSQNVFVISKCEPFGFGFLTCQPLLALFAAQTARCIQGLKSKNEGFPFFSSLS